MRTRPCCFYINKLTDEMRKWDEKERGYDLWAKRTLLMELILDRAKQLGYAKVGEEVYRPRFSGYHFTHSWEKMGDMEDFVADCIADANLNDKMMYGKRLVEGVYLM